MEEQQKEPVKIFRIIFYIFIVILILFIISIGYYNYQLSSYNIESEVEFEVKSGDTISLILKQLKDNGIIRDEVAAKVYLRLHNIDNLQAGVYDLSKTYNTKEIINILTNGKISTKDEINITFPEGKNIMQIAKIIEKNTSNSEEDVYALLEDTEYIESLVDKYWFLTDDIKNSEIYYPLEGYLFPDTYKFINSKISVGVIFETMLRQTDKILTKYKDDIESKNLNIHEFLTLASIVELEGLFDDDRAMIAGIFYKRLSNGWSLGSDVTSYYASKIDMGENPEITQAALDFISPYNTRLQSMAGKLPIGPISNPGEASILAAINPVESDYWFFIADCRTMTTIFTRTSTEHTNAVNAIKASGCEF